MKFDKNSFGLNPAEQFSAFELSPGETKKETIGIDVNENNNNKAPGMPISLTAALRTSLGVFVFSIPVMLSVLLTRQSSMINVKEMRELWKFIETEEKMYYTVPNLSTNLTSPQAIKERLLDNNIAFMEEGRTDNGSPCLYFNAKATNNLVILIQLTFQDGECTLCVKCKASPLIQLTQQ